MGVSGQWTQRLHDPAWAVDIETASDWVDCEQRKRQLLIKKKKTYI
jgi:hypothetical protein